MITMRWKRLFLSNNCSSQISKTHKAMLQWEEFEDTNGTKAQKDHSRFKIQYPKYLDVEFRISNFRYLISNFEFRISNFESRMILLGFRTME